MAPPFSTMKGSYSRRAIDDPNYIYNAVIRLIAKIPTMIAAFQLIRKGQDPIQPRDDPSPPIIIINNTGKDIAIMSNDSVTSNAPRYTAK